MHQRAHNRRSEPGHAALPRRAASPVAALQRAIGNRGMAQVLARKGAGSGKGTFENSVKVGKLGPIEIKESNIADWIGKKNPDDLIVTTTKGKHSDELKRMSESKERIDTIEVQAITGENSWVKVTFKNARIRGFAPDSEGKTESWKATDFDGVHIERTSIGTPRP
jgi:hypothetical protein